MQHRLIQCGRFNDAESLLLEAHDATSTLRDKGGDRARPIRKLLSNLYDAWGKPERAAEYQELLRQLEETDEAD